MVFTNFQLEYLSTKYFNYTIVRIKIKTLPSSAFALLDFALNTFYYWESYTHSMELNKRKPNFKRLFIVQKIIKFVSQAIIFHRALLGNHQLLPIWLRFILIVMVSNILQTKTLQSIFGYDVIQTATIKIETGFGYRYSWVCRSEFL